MKNAVAILTVLVWTLGTMAAASLQDEQAPKAEAKNFTGVVASVDANAGTISVEKKSGSAAEPASQMKFRVDDKTSIKKGGASLKLAEIKAGAQVRIEYLEKGQEKLAQTIELS